MTMNTPCVLMPPTMGVDDHNSTTRTYDVGDEKASLCHHYIKESVEAGKKRDSTLEIHAVFIPKSETVHDGYKVRVDGVEIELTSVRPGGAGLVKWWNCEGGGVA